MRRGDPIAEATSRSTVEQCMVGAESRRPLAYWRDLEVIHTRRVNVFSVLATISLRPSGVNGGNDGVRLRRRHSVGSGRVRALLPRPGGTLLVGLKCTSSFRIPQPRLAMGSSCSRLPPRVDAASALSYRPQLVSRYAESC
jgi:hypothetical protein